MVKIKFKKRRLNTFYVYRTFIKLIKCEFIDKVKCKFGAERLNNRNSFFVIKSLSG